MTARGRVLAAALACGILAALLRCGDYQRRPGLKEFDAEVKILKDAESARSRLGEPLSGYLAEYEEDYQPRRVFLSLEIQKYVKGERLTVKGDIGKDTVRVSYGEQPALDVPIVYVFKAAPPGIRAEVEKLLGSPDKKH